MAHFAKVIDGQVVTVHVLANDVITDDEGVEHEELGQAFLAELHGCLPTELVQCSYNGNMRGMYPSPGHKYDENRDAFIPPQPYPSWVLDEDTCLWVAPIPMPEGDHTWNENTQSWDAVSEA